MKITDILGVGKVKSLFTKGGLIIYCILINYKAAALILNLILRTIGAGVFHDKKTVYYPFGASSAC